MRRLIIFISALILSGCTSLNLTTLEKINPAEKTALIEYGIDGIVGPLKEILRKNGWSIIVSTGAERTAGKIGTEVNIIRSAERTTRYRFIIEQSYIGRCMASTQNFVSHYSITLVDNTTGGEVALIKGETSCFINPSDDQDFVKAIKGL